MSGNSESAAAASPLRVWIAGARPRTLPAAVVPVAIGTTVAFAAGDAVLWRAAAALVVAVAIQVGTNYANDYSDGVRGTDAQRAGPVRLVGSALRAPEAVRRAAFLSFGVAALGGLALAAATTWWLLVVGAACFLAGWFYTGGPRPYGYAGAGEIFVFVFFGLVATAGTAFVQMEALTVRAVLAGVPAGLFATGLLVVNNLRDIPTDAAAGKRTLAVRLGDAATRALYVGCIAGALLSTFLVVSPLRALTAAAVGAAASVPAARPVAAGARGRDLVPALAATARAQVLYGAALVLALVLP